MRTTTPRPLAAAQRTALATDPADMAAAAAGFHQDAAALAIQAARPGMSLLAAILAARQERGRPTSPTPLPDVPMARPAPRGVGTPAQREASQKAVDLAERATTLHARLHSMHPAEADRQTAVLADQCARMRQDQMTGRASLLKYGAAALSTAERMVFAVQEALKPKGKRRF